MLSNAATSRAQKGSEEMTARENRPRKQGKQGGKQVAVQLRRSAEGAWC